MVDSSKNTPPPKPLSRDTTRFLADVASRQLSTTVSRYERLHLSRRRGNAIRGDLLAAGLITSVAIATRSGQVVLYQLSDAGRAVCRGQGIELGALFRASLEHRYWAGKVARQFERDGFDVTLEKPIDGNGVVDVVAERPGERVAIEVETGKSDIKNNIEKLRGAEFDRVILIATTPSAVTRCQRTLESCGDVNVELMTWLDVT